MIDLHTHSTASDGTLSPEALVELAAERGLSAIAITDHDTVAGVAPAQERGDALGVEVIPAVELGASLDGVGEIHLLGYFIDIKNKTLRDRLAWLRDRAQLEAGYTAMLFGYTHPPGLTSPEFFVNTGVFAPSFYQRHAVLIRPTLKPSQFLTWHIHATLGLQQVRQGSGRSFSSTAGTRLDFLLTPKITLSLGYDYFNTASAAQFLALTSRAAGYHSNTVRASLRFRF